MVSVILYKIDAVPDFYSNFFRPSLSTFSYFIMRYPVFSHGPPSLKLDKNLLSLPDLFRFYLAISIEANVTLALLALNPYNDIS